MRQRFMQVLGSEDQEDVMTDVVRRFWTRRQAAVDHASGTRSPSRAAPPRRSSTSPPPRGVRAQQKAQDRR